MRTPLTQLAAIALLAPALCVIGSAPAQATARTCHGQVATIVGSTHSDTLVGTPGDDVIVGGKGRDVIDGGMGNDVICGNLGGDSIKGGDGDDAVFGQLGQDSLAGGEGDDRLDGGIGVVTRFAADAGDDTWISAATHDELQFIGAPNAITLDVVAGTASGWGQDTFRYSATDASLTIIGSPYDDTLLGGPGPDEILGEGGTDRIEGRGGSDQLFADRATTAAVVTHDGFAASLDGGPGDDRLVVGVAGTASGGPGDDAIQVSFDLGTPLTSDLQLRGDGGRDRLWLWDATPVGQGVRVDGVYAQVAFDMVTGTFDADALHLIASDIEDVNFETTDWHTVSTDFDITGTVGPNEISIASLDIYGSSTVVVNSGGGDDWIQSGGGDDTLNGGPGADRADAQAGTDTCISIEAPLTEGGGSNTSCEIVIP